MEVEILDVLGMPCPQPMLKVTLKAFDMKKGDILEVIGDCSTFEEDLRKWAQRAKKVILSVVDEGSGKKKIQIQF